MSNEKALLLLSDVKKENYNEERFYQISPKMFSKINEKIDAKGAHQRSLLLYLIFQQQNGDFRPAEQSILTACGMAHNKYVEARRKLAEKGLIEYEPFKYLKINYKKIME